MTPAFRRWFGDSAVVDGRGRPLVVYHGTTAKFDAFRPHERKGEQLGFGIHFAEDRSMADRYAHDQYVARKGSHPRVVDVYLSVQRPLIADMMVLDGSAEFALAKKLAGPRMPKLTNENGVRAAWMQNSIDATTGSRAARLIQEAGYDGVRYTATNLKRSAYGGASKIAESTAWVVFSPTQVKSASTNVGTYDPADARYANPDKGSRSRRTPVESALARLRSLPQSAVAGADTGDVDIPLRYDSRAAFPSGKRATGAWEPYFMGARRVAIGDLRVWQQTVGADTVEEYIRHGARDVVVVVQPDGRMVVADGHHRLMASYLLGDATTRALVYDMRETGSVGNPTRRRRR